MIVLIFGIVLLLNGFAALRRPLSALMQYDPFGKWLFERRGEQFTRRAYRIYGLAMVLIGMM
ncbi:MAG: hypothetical protein RMN25_03025, partial [Anaerolineae bacterium]|nr:hypothetical protein [Thermoflexales bacterium]MDW8406730.1 hypothetical protein [Anaerolineae bacterium]